MVKHRYKLNFQKFYENFYHHNVDLTKYIVLYYAKIQRQYQNKTKKGHYMKREKHR